MSFNFSHCLHVQQLSVRCLERGICALLMFAPSHLVINGKPSIQPFVHFDLHWFSSHVCNILFRFLVFLIICFYNQLTSRHLLLPLEKKSCVVGELTKQLLKQGHQFLKQGHQFSKAAAQVLVDSHGTADALAAVLQSVHNPVYEIVTVSKLWKRTCGRWPSPWRHKHVTHLCILHHELNFFSYSVVKNNPKWMHPEGLKFDAEMYFCCHRVSAAWHICTFSRFLCQPVPLLSVPFKQVQTECTESHQMHLV